MAKPALEKSVREIAADPRLTQRSQKRLRVAAYCRVSTELEEQESSFEGQVSYYTDKIESNQEWEMAGFTLTTASAASRTPQDPVLCR